MNSNLRAANLAAGPAGVGLWPGHLLIEQIGTEHPLATSPEDAGALEIAFCPIQIELDGGSHHNGAGLPLMAGAQTSDASLDDNVSRLVSGGQSGGDAGGSEWDYLWKNPTRVRIDSIPEPTSASLLVGGAILWAGRNRKRTS